jgi:uncharacterized PurR-regulated membrane protein YhhQ (DUF165 family)
MSEKNKYDFLEGNRAIFYVLLPIMFLVMDIYNNGWGNIEILRFIVSTFVPILVLEGLNLAVIKFNMWIDAKREIRKANMRKQ